MAKIKADKKTKKNLNKLAKNNKQRSSDYLHDLVKDIALEQETAKVDFSKDNLVSVHDVASYILKKNGKTSTWRLQKLVYYCQAWNLVWDKELLFSSPIHAWANGPVSPKLYKEHQQVFTVKKWPKGNHNNLNKKQKETIMSVLSFYGKRESFWLSELVRAESPWLEARGSASMDERGKYLITNKSMFAYYNAISYDT